MGKIRLLDGYSLSQVMSTMDMPAAKSYSVGCQGICCIVATEQHTSRFGYQNDIASRILRAYCLLLISRNSAQWEFRQEIKTFVTKYNYKTDCCGARWSASRRARGDDYTLAPSVDHWQDSSFRMRYIPGAKEVDGLKS